MTKAGPFSPVVVGFVVAGVVAIFALSVVLLTVGGGHEAARSTSASPSAIGHLGFYSLLEKLGVPVGNSRIEGDAPAGAGGMLVVDEPQNGRAKPIAIAKASTVLVILPKRWGTRDDDHYGWVERVGLLHPSWPQQVLDQVLEGATIARLPIKPASATDSPQTSAGKTGTGTPNTGAGTAGTPAGRGMKASKANINRPPAANPAPPKPAPPKRASPKPASPKAIAASAERKVLPLDALLPINTLGVQPVIEDQLQLVSSKILTPLIGSSDRMLLGELKTRHQRIWILADPDPLENFGLQKPANLRFAMAVVNTLRGDTGRVIFDDTAHGGRARTRSPLELLFQWPYVLVTIQLLVALALLLAATTVRFGGAELAPAPIALGKLRLIENIASLMDRAGHQSVVLRRYIKVKLHEAGRALHAPPGLDDGALAAWLDRIGRSRGVALQSVDILDRSVLAGGGRAQTVSRLFRDARDMDRWNRELLDGSGGRQDGR